MAEISAEEAGGQNVVAMLDTLAWAEGTDNGKQQTYDRGYDVLVGGGLFTDYSKHPNILVDLPRLGIKSTGAGRYQLLHRYYGPYIKICDLFDFKPRSQDLIAIQQMRERKALPLIQAGQFDAAIDRIRNIWASLPGAGYGQHEQSRDALRAVYLLHGGSLA